MPNDVNNILVGSAQVWIDGVEVGWTQGGVTARKANEYLDIDADQVGGIIEKKKTSERMYVSFTALESTIENMRIAMAEPSAQNVQGTALVIGKDTLSAPEHTLTLKGEAPNGNRRTYTLHRAVVSEELEHMVGARDQVGTVPFAFECLKDSDHGYSFGSFTDA